MAKKNTPDPNASPVDPNAAPAPAAPAPAKVARESSNGITRPGEGTLTREIWDVADAISAEAQRPALRDEVFAKIREKHPDISKGTLATQYVRWGTFYGVTKEIRASARAERKEAAAKVAADAAAAAKAQADAQAAAQAPAPQPTPAPQPEVAPPAA